jgi:hypothetical protein
MNIKKLFLRVCIIIITLSVFCCKKNYNQAYNITDLVDTAKIAFVPYDTVWFFIFNENCKPAELSCEEFYKTDSILTNCIAEYNKEQEKRHGDYIKANPDLENNFIIDLKNYYRQYLVIMNENNEKEVFINFLCRIYPSDETAKSAKWKTGISIVHDGGNCFFSIKINLTKMEYYNFFVNGLA